MPANTTEDGFPQPEKTDVVIMRYMSFAKLASMLSTSTLQLCRLDLLQDTYEGVQPKFVKNTITNASANDHANQDRRKRLGSTIRFIDDINRSTTYANCWCMQSKESMALWQIYGGREGVAIRTQYNKLRDALPDNVYIGKVVYINHDAETVEEAGLDKGLRVSPALLKRNFYEYESECRIIGKFTPKETTDLVAKMKLSRRAPTMQIDICIEDAIIDIVPSPIAPDWLQPCLADLIKKFDLSVDIGESEIFTRK